MKVLWPLTSRDACAPLGYLDVACHMQALPVDLRRQRGQHSPQREPIQNLGDVQLEVLWPLTGRDAGTPLGIYGVACHMQALPVDLRRLPGQRCPQREPFRRPGKGLGFSSGQEGDLLERKHELCCAHAGH